MAPQQQENQAQQKEHQMYQYLSSYFAEYKFLRGFFDGQNVLHLMFLLLGLNLLLLWSHFIAVLVLARTSIFISYVLRIGLGFTGPFPCAGWLQILLTKTTLKDASEEGHKTGA